MKALMIGATGEFAGLIVPELKKKGATIYALARDEDKGREAIKPVKILYKSFYILLLSPKISKLY